MKTIPIEIQKTIEEIEKVIGKKLAAWLLNISEKTHEIAYLTLIHPVNPIIPVPKGAKKVLTEELISSFKSLIAAKNETASKIIYEGIYSKIPCHSGTRTININFGGSGYAQTTTSRGARYSRRCNFRKLDATHTVTIPYNWFSSVYDRGLQFIKVSKSGLTCPKALILEVVKIYRPTSGSDMLQVRKLCIKNKSITTSTVWIQQWGLNCYESRHCDPEKASRHISLQVRNDFKRAINLKKVS